MWGKAKESDVLEKQDSQCRGERVIYVKIEDVKPKPPMYPE